LILCFDGLNRKAVEEYNLEVFKQVEYGDIRIPGVFSGHLWSTFVTGKPLSVHGIDSWKIDALNNPNYFKDECKLEPFTVFARKPKIMYYPFLDPRWMVFKGIEHDFTQIITVHDKVFQECCRELQSDWDLFLACFMIIDNLSHCGRLDEEKYHLLEIDVKRLISLANSTWTLIIGDKSPSHTPPGFYSSSKPLNLDNPYLSDFYNIIRRELEECYRK